MAYKLKKHVLMYRIIRKGELLWIPKSQWFAASIEVFRQDEMCVMNAEV